MRPVSANCLFKPLHTKFRESAVIEILESETVSSLYTLLVPNAPYFSQSRFCRPQSTPSDVMFISIIFPLLKSVPRPCRVLDAKYAARCLDVRAVSDGYQLEKGLSRFNFTFFETQEISVTKSQIQNFWERQVNKSSCSFQKASGENIP